MELIIYSKKLYTILATVKGNPCKYFEELPAKDKVLFIAGLTDSEGCVSRREIAIYNSNRELLDEICLFLVLHGVNCKVKPNKNIWRIRVRSRESVNLFLKLIPTIKTLPPQVKPRRRNPRGEGPVSQSTTAWFCRGKLGGTDFQG